MHSKEYWGGRIASQIVYCFPECPDGGSLRGSSNLGKWFKKYWRRDNRLKGIDADTPKIRDASIVHFPQNLLGHFYTFVYFQDPIRNAQVKQMVRDHIHFKKDIFARARVVIDALGGDFAFSCLHIRRGDFQFKEVWTDANTIVRNVEKLILPGERVYIATDEKDKSFFGPMKEKWGAGKVSFYNDFAHLIKEPVPKIWIGCVESVVCTRARTFVGSRKSTFTGYIDRMRGYMRDVEQDYILDAQTRFPDEYRDAFKPSWYTLQHNFGGGFPYWGREHKEAWEGIHNPFF